MPLDLTPLFWWRFGVGVLVKIPYCFDGFWLSDLVGLGFCFCVWTIRSFLIVLCLADSFQCLLLSLFELCSDTNLEHVRGFTKAPQCCTQWPSIKAGSRDMNASKTEPRTWFLFYRAWFVALRCLLWPVNGQSHHLTHSSFTHLNLEGTFLGVASLTNPKKGRECFTHTLKYSNKVWRILKKEIWNWIFGCLKIQVMSLYLGFPYNTNGYKAFLSFRKSKKNTCQYMCTFKTETNS